MEQKIIFTGPVGAGKTTAISAISDIPVVHTEAKATDEVSLRKEKTTVAMDYGVLNLEGGAKVHLYGTPGQERFSFMWDILSMGGVGVILMLDNARPDPLRDLEFFLDAFETFVAKNKIVIAVTRMDVNARPGLYAYHKRLNELGYQLPIFEVDARKSGDVKILMLALLAVLDPELRS